MRDVRGQGREEEYDEQGRESPEDLHEIIETGTVLAHRHQLERSVYRKGSCMKEPKIFLGLLAGLSLMLVSGVFAQQSAPPEQSKSASQSSQSQPSGFGHKPDALTAVQGILLSTEALLGSDVKNPQGQDVGDLKHLMLDPRTGRVMYAVVAIGGFLGMGEKTVIVPWYALEVARDGKSLVLNVAPQMLQQAPAYEKGKESIYAPTSASRGGGWGMETPYGRLYDPAKEQTISGQVVSIETRAPMPGMTPGMQMLVQTEDGKSAHVQVGPVWYLERQDLDMKENTRVQVTGAQAEIDGQPVLIAREVQFDGQVLTLRDAQGMPMWSSLRSTVVK
jgi:sporulation protein YlmC with PRC-barrel domain